MSDSNYLSEREEKTINYLKGNFTNTEDEEFEEYEDGDEDMKYVSKGIKKISIDKDTSSDISKDSIGNSSPKQFSGKK